MQNFRDYLEEAADGWLGGSTNAERLKSAHETLARREARLAELHKDGASPEAIKKAQDSVAAVQTRIRIIQSHISKGDK